MVASKAVDERIGLVFTWEPRARVWVKERGPEDAAPPPAPPLDDGAVQTYFLDPSNGRWQPTILGLRARQIAAELKDLYRSAAVSGLAIREPERPRPAVEQERRRRAPVPAIGVLLLIALLAGGGAVAANQLLAANATTPPAPTTSPASAVGGGAAPASPTAAPAASATAPAPSAPAAPTTAVRTPAPATAPPATAAPAIITLSTRLSNGTTITFTGPSSVVQGTAWDAQFTARQANGQPALNNLNVYVGPLGSGHSVTLTGNAGGVYTTSIRVTLPKGDQLLSVKFGANGEVRTLGTITVR